jgi:hypothetical protein
VVNRSLKLRKLRWRVKSRPETGTADKRLAFFKQTPSIQPEIKLKQPEMSISHFPQGFFVEMFRLQHEALTVRRPKPHV